MDSKNQLPFPRHQNKNNEVKNSYSIGNSPNYESAESQKTKTGTIGFVILTNRCRLCYKIVMLRLLGLTALLILQTQNSFSQKTPAEGFFEDEANSLEVKTFRLPLDKKGTTVNCYLAWQPDSKRAVIIDPGTPSAEIVGFIRTRQLKLMAVLNTHGHPDHCGGNCFFTNAFSVPVYIHSTDRAEVSRVAGANCSMTCFPNDRRLILDGLEIDVIATPGHTPGSVCLKIGETLFSGDTLFAGSIGKPNGDTHPVRQANFQLEVRSIRQRLLSLPASTRVFPGHGPTTTIGAEKSLNPYLLGN